MYWVFVPLVKVPASVLASKGTRGSSQFPEVLVTESATAQSSCNSNLGSLSSPSPSYHLVVNNCGEELAFAMAPTYTSGWGLAGFRVVVRFRGPVPSQLEPFLWGTIQHTHLS